MNIQPHPKNVPGPFYVVDGCCLACDVPISEAPDLFAYDAGNHCFVKRQPVTQPEFDRAFRAAWAAEVQCIRYRGNDPQVLRRFAELGEPQLCDVSPPQNIGPVVRPLVTFDTDSLDHAGLSALELAELYRDSLVTADSLRGTAETEFRYRFMPLLGDSTTASLTYSWFEDHQHSVEFRVVGKPDGRWLMLHDSSELDGGRGVSLQLDDWLKNAGRFCRIRWYTVEQWTRAGVWQESPQ